MEFSNWFSNKKFSRNIINNKSFCAQSVTSETASTYELENNEKQWMAALIESQPRKARQMLEQIYETDKENGNSKNKK